MEGLKMPFPIEDVTEAIEENEIPTGSGAFTQDGFLVRKGGLFYILPHSGAGVRLLGDGGSNRLYMDTNALNSLRSSPLVGRVFLRGSDDPHFQLVNFGQLSIGPEGGNRFMYADGFVEYSSLTLKEEIEDLDSEEALGIIPKKYKVRGKTSFGLLLEDVEARIPEAVNSFSDPETGKVSKGWNVSSMFAHILSIVRRFRKRLNRQKDRLDAIEQRLEVLES
jgi:hypothetical protein